MNKPIDKTRKYTIRVLFFATLKDRAGMSETTLELHDEARVNEIRTLLKDRFPGLAPVLDISLVAVNREYASNDSIIPENAEIAFFPPVSGGADLESLEDRVLSDHPRKTTVFYLTQDELDLNKLLEEITTPNRKLGMYRTNAPLDACSPEIGRLAAFTPGWLENESIFLHMAYKYLLATLAAGLRDEFFADMRRGLAPFFDPQTYGRSPLEHSSFIVSSAHPDRSLHGAGFVARLSGSTAEFLSLWHLMFVGPQPFCMQQRANCT